VKIPIPITSGAGKLPQGITELPFEFKLQLDKDAKLFETYHGILVNVRYTLSVEVKKSGFLAKPLKKSIEIIVVIEVLFYLIYY
jgi:hypothetical protein